MQRLPILGAVCLINLLTSATNVLAKEPHSAKSHDYTGSIYNNGPMVTLEDAINRAIEASPKMKSANAVLNARKGAEWQAGMWENPELSFEAENVAGGGQYNGTDAAEYTYGLSQKVEIGGKRSARRKTAEAMRKAQNTQMLVERLNLERDVHIAYEDVLAEAEAVKLAFNQEKLAKDVLTTVSKRVQAAAEPEIQRSKAEVAYATSRIAREQEQRQLEIAKDKLVRLWGASQFDVSLDHNHFFELSAPEAMEAYHTKLKNIPDIQRLVHLKAEKESQLKLEQANTIPDPRFSLGVRDFRDSGDQAFIFGVSLPIPVLNANRGNIAKARAELNETEYNKQQVELLLEQELVQNWQEWNGAYQEAKHLNGKLIPAAQKAFSLARSGYEKGRFPYLEVLDAQRTLFAAKTQYHSTLKRYHAARANVERLTTHTGDK